VGGVSAIFYNSFEDCISVTQVNFSNNYYMSYEPKQNVYIVVEETGPPFHDDCLSFFFI